MKKIKNSIFYVFAIILMAAATILYFINCNTQFYKSSGIDRNVIILTAAALCIEAVVWLAGKKIAEKIGEGIANLIPMVPSILLMYVFMSVLNSRIYSIATILTFENNAKNVADLKIAVAAMICYFVAMILAVCAQCKMLKKQ